MFRLTIPLVAGIFVSDHFFQGALPVLVSGTGILGCLIGLIVLVKWQGYLSRWLFGGMVFMFLFCVGALLLQQKWQRVDYEWSSGKNMYQGVIVDVPQEKAKTYLCKLRIDKEMSERGIVPVNRMILVYIMKDSLSVNLLLPLLFGRDSSILHQGIMHLVYQQELHRQHQIVKLIYKLKYQHYQHH